MSATPECAFEVAPGQPCPDPGTESVRVRDRVTNLTTLVAACAEHKRDHDRKAARQRMTKKR